MRVNGANEVIRRLKSFGEAGHNKIAQVVAVTAQEVATDAAQRAPTGHGQLKQSISALRDTDTKWWVKVNVFYAAYVEFGTGIYVVVAPEWKDIAWSYYVNGKGYLYPSPFLYPAFVAGRQRFERDIKDALNHLIRSFNNRY